MQAIILTFYSPISYIFHCWQHVINLNFIEERPCVLHGIRNLTSVFVLFYYQTLLYC